jgi:hypothetical protein
LRETMGGKKIFEKDIWKSDKRPILIHHSNV